MIQLHDFQLTCAREVWRRLIIEDQPSCLLQAPTGSGKTVMGSFFLNQTIIHRQFDAAVFAHRREIVKQTATKLSQSNIWPGIIMSGDVLSPSRNVQVSSIDSYSAWVKSGKIRELRPHLVWVDEAHRVMSPTYLRVVKAMMEAGAKLFGTTATPIRSDGTGLGDLFTSMVCAPGPKELIARGFLCPIEYFTGIVPDVKGVKLTAGDYDAFELQQVCNQKMLIGSIVDNWMRLSQGRPTLCFATGVDHSMSIVDKFKERGIRAEHIDGETNTKRRDDVYGALKSGDVQVVSNANVYVEGSDFPFVSCVIDAQPTKSVGRYLQKGGRGMRTCEGKTDLHYHDHAGNVYNHGRLEMKREWELVNGKEQVEKFQKERDSQRAERVCPECSASYTGMTCPQCGYEYVRTGKELDYLPADLERMTVEEAEKIQFVPSPAEKQRWFQEALHYAIERGKKPGWAAHCYEAKWKEGMPPREWMRLVPRPSTEDVRHYMGNQLKRASIIARARAMKNGKRKTA